MTDISNIVWNLEWGSADAAYENTFKNSSDEMLWHLIVAPNVGPKNTLIVSLQWCLWRILNLSKWYKNNAKTTLLSFTVIKQLQVVIKI